MKTLIVIHIGLPKAGSASIQSFLGANEDALRTLSIDYPKIGRGDRKDHHNFSSELKKKSNFDPSVGTLEQLHEYLSAQQSEIKIISTEKFEKLEIEEIKELQRMLRGFGHKFRIVMIVRDLLELVPSSYAQKIRYGMNFYDFDTFFEKRIDEGRADYFETAKKWADVFLWKRLRIRFLAPQHLIKGDLIDDFLTIAGLDTEHPEVHALPRPGMVNSTNGWRILEALRALYASRHWLRIDHPVIKFLVGARRPYDRKLLEAAAMAAGERLGWANDRGLYLTRQQAERCLEVNRASVAMINEYLPEKIPLPLDLDERGFVEREFLPSAWKIPRIELREFYDQVGDSVADQNRIIKQAGRAWQAA